jgi:putrescine transport system permease protein
MKRERSFWQSLVVRIPYAWLLVLFLLPFLIVLKISLSQSAIARPPYTPVFNLAAGWHGIRAFFAALSLDNYALIGSDPIYVLSYLKSVEIAAFATLILLLVGYPIAYAIARTPPRWQAVLIVLTVLPFWTSLLIRIYAWMNILQHDGPLNQLLVTLAVVKEPPVWLSTDTAIYIGIVYSYLPFMVLPLYATLQKLDESLLEAAADLGCPRWKTFWLVTLPLSSSGVIAGVLLCFIPIVGEFVIPDLLGGSRSPMIGQTIWMEFFGNKDWPAAAAIAVVLVCLLVTPIVAYQNQAMHAVERD